MAHYRKVYLFVCFKIELVFFFEKKANEFFKVFFSNKLKYSTSKKKMDLNWILKKIKFDFLKMNKNWIANNMN